jgi:hypothetical protein
MAAASPGARKEDTTERRRIGAVIPRCRRSPAQQHMIVGRVLDQLTTEEVADALGKTGGQVRSLTHRALARLGDCAPLLEAQAASQARGGKTPADADDNGPDDAARWQREMATVRTGTAVRCGAGCRPMPRRCCAAWTW